jgi:uncharacterized membrane protein
MHMPGRMLVAAALVALIVNQLARVVPGAVIVVPMFLPPLLAAGVALILAFRRAPPVAYVAGTMGTLIGADLLNLGRERWARRWSLLAVRGRSTACSSRASWPACSPEGPLSGSPDET